MALQEECTRAQKVLESIQAKLQHDKSVDKVYSDGIASLVYMLESPLFRQLLNIEEALGQLKLIQGNYPVNENDFDISTQSGRLVLQGALVNYDLSAKGIDEPNVEDFEDMIVRMADGRDIVHVSLFKPEDASLGFSVVGLQKDEDNILGIFVEAVQRGSIADKDGRLQQNDQILAINGHVLDSSRSPQEAIRLLQRASGNVDLVVAREPQPAVVAADTLPLASRQPAPAEPAPAPPLDMVLSTEWCQLEVIDLVNDGSGLGFGIIGGKSTGVVVKTIVPGGMADQDGRLRSGDHLLHINDINVRGMGSEQVAAVLRQCSAHVRLIVARCIAEPLPHLNLPHAPIIPTSELDDHLHQVVAAMMGVDLAAANAADLQLDGDAVDLVKEQQPPPQPIVIQQNQVHVQQQQSHQPPPPQQPVQQQQAPPQHSQPPQVLSPVAAAVAINGVSKSPSVEKIASPDVQVYEVDLTKNAFGLGITIAGYISESTGGRPGIFVKAVTEGSAAAEDGRIQFDDQIIGVDGKSLDGFSNLQAVEALRNTGQTVHLTLARHKHKYSGALPLYELGSVDDRDSSYDYNIPLTADLEAALKASWQAVVGGEFDIVVARVVKFRERGGLGISLEGTVDVEDGREVRPHHYIRSVLPDGPVGVSGVLRSGDELLEVNNHRLWGLSHVQVVSVLKELPQNVVIVCARHRGPIDLSSNPSLDREPATPIEPLVNGLIATTAAAELPSPPMPMESPDLHMVKAKSEIALPVSVASNNNANNNSGAAAGNQPLNRIKSRSLEPLTSLAMWSTKPEVVILNKGDRGLGFSILDYQDPLNPEETIIVIRSLVPGGVAQTDGRLLPGDRLMYVNDQDVRHASLDDAVQALKGAPKGPVRISVVKPLPVSEMSELPSPAEEAVTPVAVATVNSAPPATATTPKSNPVPVEKRSNEYQTVYDSKDVRREQKPSLQSQIPTLKTVGGRTTAEKEKPRIAPKPSAEVMWAQKQLYVSDKTNSYNSPPDGPPPLPPSTPAPDMTPETRRVHALTSDDPSVVPLSPSLSPALASSGATLLDNVPPLPASLERTIKIHKKNDPLGVTVDAVNNGINGCIIRGINPSEAVGKDGRLAVGDYMVTVNNETLRRATNAQARAVIRRASLLSMDISITYISAADIMTFRDTAALMAKDQSPAALPNPLSPRIQHKFFRPTIGGASSDGQAPSSPAAGGGSKAPADDAAPVKSVETSVLHSRPLPPATLEPAATAGVTKSVPFASQLAKPRLVEVQRREGESLGINIVVAKVEMPKSSQADGLPTSPVFAVLINNILEDSPAGRSKGFRIGDRVLEVNNVDLRSSTHERAVDVIRKATSPIRFLVHSLPTPEQESPAPVRFPESISPTGQESTWEELVKRYGELGGVLHLVELERTPGSTGLGLSLSGNRNPSVMSTFVVAIQPDSVAAADGRIQVGDELMEINGHVLYGRSHLNASTIVKGVNTPRVRIVLLRRPDFAEHMAVPVGLTSPSTTSYRNDPSTQIPTSSSEIEAWIAAKEAEDALLQTRPGKAAMQPVKMNENGVATEADIKAAVAARESSERPVQRTASQPPALQPSPRLARAVQKPDALPLPDDPSTCAIVPRKECTIEIQKGKTGLGLSIVGGADTLLGMIIVHEVYEDGAAARDGRLWAGDQILEVNGEDLRNASHERAINVLRQTPAVVRMIVYRDDSILKEDDIYDTFVIELVKKPNKGLGLSIVGRKSLPGVFVSDIVKGGAAEVDGRIKSGDQIISVNDEDLRNATQDHAAALLKTLIGKVTLTVGRLKSTTKSSTSRRSSGVSLNKQKHGKDANDNDRPSSSGSSGASVPRSVSLYRDAAGSLGFSVLGGQNLPFTIANVQPNSPAAASRALKVGDRIVSIGGHETTGMDHADIVELLRTLDSPVVIEVLAGSALTDLTSSSSDFFLTGSAVKYITLERGNNGLGFSIIGGHGSPYGDLPIYVKTVFPQSSAALNGGLKSGDQIVAVNGISLAGMSHAEAADILKRAEGRVELIVKS